MGTLRHELGDVAHQGVAAEITPLPPWSEDDLLSALQTQRAPLLLALDGVQDPHNLGACLRTADACGALAVIVPRDRAAQLTAAVRQALAAYKNQEDWKQLMLNGMGKNFSWEQPAREYVGVYEKIRALRVPK